MFKTKLFATICAAASAVTVAATALTLAVAGPSGVQSIHTLSANDAIASSIAGVFNSASDSADELTDFIDVITSNVTSTNIGFTINSMEGYDELAGFGGALELQLDTESEAAALLLDATLGSVTVIDGVLYVDKNEVIAAVPSLFDGVLKAGLDNLEEDLTNSFIGEYILGDTDLEELEESFALFMSEYETMMPEFEFDSEKFTEGLTDTIDKAFSNAMDNMDAKDLGMQKLNGGSYQCYEAKIPVRELSYILRDSLTYCLESEEFQSLVDQYIDYMSEISGEDMSEMVGFSGADLGMTSSLISSYWNQAVTAIEDVLGKNVELTIYITDTVELAGLGFDFYVINDKISYNESDADLADLGFNLMCDFTGGKNIGDYTDVSVTLTEYDEVIDISYTQKCEANGDFDIAFNATNGDEAYAITLDGNYVVDGEFFSLVVDSFKLIENESVFADFGFTLGFKPIDAVTKPSTEPVYDIWEMDEDDFLELLEEMSEKLEELVEMFE